MRFPTTPRYNRYARYKGALRARCAANDSPCLLDPFAIDLGVIVERDNPAMRFQNPHDGARLLRLANGVRTKLVNLAERNYVAGPPS